LTKFGAPLDNLSRSDFETSGTILQIGVEPRRIDIITKIDGVSFDEAIQDCDMVMLEGLHLPVISKRMLIVNKMATGRERDRLDAEQLQKLT
jgi:hypothetical protein